MCGAILEPPKILVKPNLYQNRSVKLLGGSALVIDGCMTLYPIHIISDHHGPLVLESWTPLPLLYDRLKSAKGRTPAQLTTQFTEVIARDANGTEYDCRGYEIKSEAQSDYSNDFFALVQGGWLPSQLSGAHYMLLPDRNVVGRLGARRLALVDAGRPEDLLDLLLDNAVTVNPMAYAMEGAQGHQPDENEVGRLLEKAHSEIRRAMPSAKVLPNIASATKGLMNLLADERSSLEREQHFLMEAFPLLRPVLSAGKRKPVIAELRSIAEKNEVSVKSFAFLLAWLTLVLPQDKNPAFRILKPHEHRNASVKAYNALSDVRLLKLLTYAIALFPDKPTAVLTGDIGLAQFWVGLGVDQIVLKNGHPTFTIVTDGDFFSEASEEELKIFQ